MKEKIYAIIANDGINTNVVKCFTNYLEAQKYKEELIEEEEEQFWMAKKCKECERYNPECPFYVEAFNLDEVCGNKRILYTYRNFQIVETELVYGEKNKNNS